MPVPFRRMPYDEMLERFGSDKPDLRYGMELVDLVGSLRGLRVQRLRLGRGRRRRDQGAVRAGRRQPEPQGARQAGRGCEGPRRRGTGVAGRRSRRIALRSPVEKFLSDEERTGIVARTGAAAGDLICVVADRPRPGGRRARRLPPRSRGAARPDPRGSVGVLLVLGAAAVRVERGGGPVGGQPPPVHRAADRRPRPDDGKGPRLRPRAERVRDRRRLDPDPRARRSSRPSSTCSGSHPTSNRRSSGTC